MGAVEDMSTPMQNMFQTPKPAKEAGVSDDVEEIETETTKKTPAIGRRSTRKSMGVVEGMSVETEEPVAELTKTMK